MIHKWFIAIITLIVACQNKAQEKSNTSNLTLNTTFQANSEYHFKTTSVMELDIRVPGNEMMEEMLKNKTGGQNPVTTTETMHTLKMGAIQDSNIPFVNTITSFFTYTEPKSAMVNAPDLTGAKIYGKMNVKSFSIDSCLYQGVQNQEYKGLFGGIIEVLLNNQKLPPKKLQINDTILQVFSVQYPIQPIGQLTLYSQKLFRLKSIEGNIAKFEIETKMTNPKIVTAPNGLKIDAHAIGSGIAEYDLQNKLFVKTEIKQTLTQEVINEAYSIKQIMTTKTYTSAEKITHTN